MRMGGDARRPPAVCEAAGGNIGDPAILWSVVASLRGPSWEADDTIRRYTVLHIYWVNHL
eukprot:CAMPEP_0195079644 /NCGR_PEP_ID=MMETSP0448-20130528/21528_1 /TAXON_ID=66468 /ORGANISM="Heterocapsa triquestra, Strain CCMP 448" /LENGTH=59 /DNA_ID=CAMNT_0040112515 /DNA_START=95 /DNA_END=270 /DNA_ORIENTATION=+